MENDAAMEQRRAVSARSKLQSERLREAGCPPDRTLTSISDTLPFGRILHGEFLAPGHTIWIKMWNAEGTQWQLFQLTVMSEME